MSLSLQIQKTSTPCAIPTWEAWHALRNGWDLNLLPWIWKGLQAGRGSTFVCKSLGNISGFLRLRLAVAWLDDELFWQANNIRFTPDCIWNVHQIAGQQLIERFSLKIPQLVVVRLFFSLQEACSRKKGRLYVCPFFVMLQTVKYPRRSKLPTFHTLSKVLKLHISFNTVPILWLEGRAGMVRASWYKDDGEYLRTFEYQKKARHCSKYAATFACWIKSVRTGPIFTAKKQKNKTAKFFQT